MDIQQMREFWALMDEIRPLPAPNEGPSGADDLRVCAALEARRAFIAGLAAAKAEFSPIEKNREVSVVMKSGGSYRYRYAELHTILDAITPSLSAHGFALTMPVTGSARDGGTATLVLEHEGGGIAESHYTMAPVGDIKEWGSQLSYVQRYLVSKLLCLATDSDSDDAPTRDGEVSAESRPKPITGRQQQAAPKAQSAPKAAPKVDDDEPPPPDDQGPESHTSQLYSLPAGADLAARAAELKAAKAALEDRPRTDATMKAAKAALEDRPRTDATMKAITDALRQYQKAHKGDPEFKSLVGPEFTHAVLARLGFGAAKTDPEYLRGSENRSLALLAALQEAIGG